MNRRHFISSTSACASLATLNTLGLGTAFAQKQTLRTLNPLVLIELKGGNDGLNTLIPYTDPLYYSLRPSLAIAENKLIKLTPYLGLHPALTDLGEL